MPSWGLSHIWVLLCNISIFAITICILVGCRTASESNYSLINADRAFLTASFGEECVNASIPVLPDVYKVGLSGSCKVKDGVTACESHLPPSLNWVRLFEADIATANTTGGQADILEQCMTLIKEKGVNHVLNNRLAVALLSLLVVSIILNVTALVIALLSSSAFGIAVFVPALLDEIVLVVCIGICMGIMNHEVGGYIPDEKIHDVSDKAILGVAFWMLLGIFGGRAISNPALLKITILVALTLPLVCISLLLSIFGCGGGVASSAAEVWVYVAPW